MRRFWAITLALFGTAAVATADDAAITKQLLGRWTTCVTGGAETEPDGTIRYADGGAFAAEGKVKLGGDETADVKLEGTWKVQDGTIVHRVTKSSHPGLAPVGGELREKVVSIDAKTMTVKRGVGKERERKRTE